MKRATVYLYDWQHARLTKLMKKHGMPSLSDTIRTILTYAAKEFEAYLSEEKGTEEEEEPHHQGIQLLMRLVEETRRLEEAGLLQNISFPGFWWDSEPTLNRVGEAFGSAALNSFFQRDPTWDMLTTGRRA